MIQSVHALPPARWKCCECTCRHVEEEGEDAPPVIASPKDPPRSIKGERQHATCQLTGAPLYLLSGGDVHHLQVVLAVSYLQHTNGSEDLHYFHTAAVRKALVVV